MSATAIALAPIQPLPPGSDLAPALRSAVAVDLAAAIDPFTPWIETFQGAAANISGLVNTWVEMPLPILQQVGTNVGTYISELPAIGTIIEEGILSSCLLRFFFLLFGKLLLLGFLHLPLLLANNASLGLPRRVALVRRWR